MGELAYFYNVSRILEEFVKLPPAFPSQDIRDRYLVLISAMAENPASHKYDATKGINIRSVFPQSLVFVIQ